MTNHDGKTTPINSNTHEAHAVLNPRPQIPDHELLRCIGKGSYGEVWLVGNVMGSYRAVKIVSRQTFDHDRPFEREFTGIQKFEPISRSHPSQVAILHVGRGEGYFYYVMELADDQTNGPNIIPETYVPKTLRSELHRHGKLPCDQCLEMSLALTTALDHLHKNGLVHRDIKPSNIIFVNGIPKLADIGLVTSIDASRSYVGTEGFLPPEGPGTPQADIYSLGKVIYEMCTGRDRQDFPELPTNLPELPERSAILELNAVMARACQQNPSKRYQSAAELREDLLLLEGGKSVARLHTIELRLSKLKRASLMGSLTILLATAAFLWQSHEAQRMRKLADENRDQVIQLYTANGTRLLADGDSFGAMVWFAEALARDQGHPEREEIQRLRLGSLLAHSPKLSQILHEDGKVQRIAFSPDSQRMVIALDRTARVWDVTTGQPVSSPMGHSGFVSEAAFSPSGHELLTTTGGHYEGRIWNADTGAPITSPLQHNHLIHNASFSPNGTLIVTATTLDGVRADRHPYIWDGGPDRLKAGGHAHIWDARTGQALLPPLWHPGAVTRAWFTFDGRSLLTTSREWLSIDNEDDESGTSASFPDKLRVWDVSTGKMLEPAWLKGQDVVDAAFSPDNQRVLVEFSDGTLQIRDAITGSAVSPSWKVEDPFSSINFSSDGQVVLHSDQGSRIFDSASGKPITKLLNGTVSYHGERRPSRGYSTGAEWWASDPFTGQTLVPHLSHIEGTVWSPNGRWIATKQRNGMVQLWDLAGATRAKVILQQRNGISSIAFNSKGDRIITKSREGIVRLWNAETGKPTIRPIWRGVDVIKASFSPDGASFGIASSDRKIRICDARTGAPISPPLDLPNGDVTELAFSPDGKKILTTIGKYGFGKLCIGDCNTGKQISSHPSMAQSADFHPFTPTACFSSDGQRVSTINSDGSVQIWDIKTGHPLTAPWRQEPQVGDPQPAFSPDGQRVVTAGAGLIRFWEATTGLPIGPTIKDPASVGYISYSPDGTRIVTRAGLSLRIWNVETGEPITPPLQHKAEQIAEWVSPVFSPEGHFLASAGMTGEVYIWDALTGELISSIFCHDNDLVDISFSPDGHRLFIACADGTVKVWDLPISKYSAEDLRIVTQLLANRRIDSTGALVRTGDDPFSSSPPQERGGQQSMASTKKGSTITPPSPVGSLSTWQALRAQHPELFSVTSKQVLAWHYGEALDLLKKRYWSSALFHLEQVTNEPALAKETMPLRVQAQAELGRWDKALEAFSQMTSWEADEESDWLRCAEVFLGKNDRAGYGKICNQLLARFGNRDSCFLNCELTWLGSLVPDSTIDSNLVVKLAERALTNSPEQGDRFDVITIYGAALYRAGRFEEAIAQLDKAVKARRNEGNITDCLLLAMAHQKLSHKETANRWLDQARTKLRTEQRIPRDRPRPWTERLELKLLSEEATELCSPASK